MQIIEKLQRLQQILKEMDRVLVAYSGGVDSTFLLKVAYDTLGDNTLGVLGISETVPRDQIFEAQRMAEDIGVPFQKVDTDEFQREEFVQNGPDRCFHCKTALFQRLWEIATEKGFPHIVDGNNADDVGDYRPGMKAARNLNVRSPLMEAGLTKEEIRELSRQLGLPTWNQAASPCLSSRFPYGTRITEDGLIQVEKAEKYLKELGFYQVRARYHDRLVRIEVDKDNLEKAVQHADLIVSYMKSIGFSFVTLDLAGYRLGSFNDLL
ncbi:ATP-dependent sacrificial sulfur transferase LarE [Heliobacterium mobile]|uniref:ATP-dependent sacrificial sulfur transferase LarE n=1 Tax=Heliobacterium mobile TaxID=28064 RepID=UPI0012D8295E|nr:ATP-dependent sacrificial sulfur transferase LarE [Heliobacterium mobile]